MAWVAKKGVDTVTEENPSPAVFTKAEIVQASRTADWLILALSFLVFTGGFHVHAMLTMGDWDFWTDWKDRRLWVAVTPIMTITFPAAVQYFLWGKLRLPFGATFTILGLLFGEWVNRYFNFWGWTYFPINFVWAATLVPGAIILDVVLLWSKSYLITAVVGGLGFGLIFYPGNWAMLAPLHQPVEYNGMSMTIADIQGYQYVRTGTPEYIRFVEKGTLRTFGKDVVPVSAFFSAYICMLIYGIWHIFGRWYSTTSYLQEFGWPGYQPPAQRSEDATVISGVFRYAAYQPPSRSLIEIGRVIRRLFLGNIYGVPTPQRPCPFPDEDDFPPSPEGPTQSRQILVTGHSPTGEIVIEFKPEASYALRFRVAAPSRINLAQGDIDVTSVPETGLDTHWIVASANVEFLAVSHGGKIWKGGSTWLAEFDLAIPGQGDSATVTLNVRTTKASGELILTLLVAGEEYRKLTVNLDLDARVKDVACTVHSHMNLGTTHEWTTPLEHIAAYVSGRLAYVSTIRGVNDYGTVNWMGNSSLLKEPIEGVRSALEKFRVTAEAHLNNLDVADMDRRLRTGQWKPYDWNHLPREADAAHDQALTTLASGDELGLLANEGYRLFDTCFPTTSTLRGIIENLKPGSRLDFVWTSLGAIDWVSHVPWALMYLDPLRASEAVNCERFLGLRYRIGSKSWEPNAPSRALGDPAQVNVLHLLYWGSDPKDEVGMQSLWQRNEFAKWERHYFVPEPNRNDPKNQVVLALQTPEPHPAGILYLYCRCSGKVLQFGETSKIPDIVDTSTMYQGRLETGPLVFANACATVAADPLGTSELESRFFPRHIRAFLGTESKVPVEFASRFAWLFFQFFLRKADPDPMAAGEALAQARLFLWTQYRNPGGLFYCLVNNYDLYLASNEEVAQLPRR